MFIKVDFRWTSLNCQIPEDRNGDEPYLWTFFMTVDGKTVTPVTDANGDTTRLVGSISVAAGPGGQGNLGASDVIPPRSIAIPPEIGAYATTLEPIRVVYQGRQYFVPGRILAIAALLDEDNSPGDAIDRVHETVRRFVETSANAFVASLDGAELAGAALARAKSTNTPLEAALAALLTERLEAATEAIGQQIKQLVEVEALDYHTPGFFWEGIDPDDTLGRAHATFTETDVAAAPHRQLYAEIRHHDEDTNVVTSSYEIVARLDATLALGASDVDELYVAGPRTVDETVRISTGKQTVLCVPSDETFEVRRYRQDESVTYTLRYPFLAPTFEIEGRPLAGDSGLVQILTTHAKPYFYSSHPSGQVFESETGIVTVTYERVSDGQRQGIRLRNYPGDGRYGVWLDVFVAFDGPVRVARILVQFDGLSVESDLYDEYKKCMEKFRRPSDDYALSTPGWQRLPWGPTARERYLEERLRVARELVETGRMTERDFARLARALPAQLRVRAPRE